MNVPDKTTGSSLTGDEFTKFKNEVANAIDSSGQIAADNSLQLKQAVARYVANGFCYIDSGVADAYVLAPIANYSGKTNDAPSAYLNNQIVMFIAGTSNTTASTINVNSIGVKNLKKNQWADALVSGDIVAGKLYCAMYKTTADCWELVKINDAGSAVYTPPAGSILTMPYETIPAGYLECNGASLLRSSYASLFAAISTAFGAADSTHFNIPDYRGIFLRGWSHGNTTNDPDRATRLNRGDGTTGDNVGTVQLDAIRNITGSWAGSVQDSWTNTYTGALYEKTDASVSVDRGDIGTASKALGFDASLSVTTGGDNRPINVYVMHCIKY